MIRIEMIGNLGADAEIKENNGRKFVTFRMAHTDKWTDKVTNQDHVSTTWASCAINGDGGAITAFLKKGTKVFVRGTMSMNIYSSPKSHQMECGLNISVWEIELCGAAQSKEPAANDASADTTKNVPPKDNGNAKK